MPEHLQTKHFFNVTLELREPMTREEAKVVLLDLLDRGQGKSWIKIRYYPTGEHSCG